MDTDRLVENGIGATGLREAIVDHLGWDMAQAVELVPDNIQEWVFVKIDDTADIMCPAHSYVIFHPVSGGVTCVYLYDGCICSTAKS